MITTWQDKFIKRDSLPAGELARRFNIRNPRKHPERQGVITEGSLDKLGWIAAVKLSTCGGHPSLADNPAAVMFDGHLRVTLALSKFGTEALVPVEWYDLTEAETNQALLLLDQTTGMATLDPVVLDDLIKNTPPLELPEWDEWLGETLDKLALDLLGQNTEPADTPPLVDKAEELQQKWQVQPGDIWTCAGHYVICGDCREPETWRRLLAAGGVEKVNGVFTSPPYAEQRKAQYGGVPTAEYVEWWDAVQSNVRANLAGDGSFFVNIKAHIDDGQRVLYIFDLICTMVRQWQWRFIEEFCWLRNPTPKQVIEHFKQGFEPVYHFSLDKFKFNPDDVRHFSDNVPIPGGEGTGNTNWAGRQGRINALANTKGTIPGMAYPSTVLDFAKSGGQVEAHAAAFPVALPTFFLKAYSDVGDIWIDPFLGSGTTTIAAHNEKRRGMGIERLEKYVSVCLERFQAHTSQQPVKLTD